MTRERPLLPVRPAVAGAVGGALGVAGALAVGELFAGLLPGIPSLLPSVGRWLIDAQPPGAKDLMVSLFGTNDKLVLELVIVLVSLAIGALLGILSLRAFRVAAYAFAAFGLVGFLAALRDNLAVPTFTAVAAATSVAFGIGIMSWLSGVGSERHGPAATPWTSMPSWSRRDFMVRTGALAAASVAVGGFGRWLTTERERSPASLPIPGTGAVVELPAGADLGIDGLTPIVVPNDDFYRIDTALIIPAVDVTAWSLKVTGMVDKPVTLTYQELVALPLIEQYVTISCVSNEVGGDLVGNAKWTGVRLRDVLAMAGVQRGATQLIGRSVDGFTAGMPTAWVMDPRREPMIAVKMNGEPLPRLHGYPARLIVPGLYGYVSATKWLTELKLTTMEAEDGYWVPLGWAKQAPILTQSRIDLPPRGRVPAGQQVIAGIAWAPDRGVARVEVQIDGGDWHDAVLSHPISDATWVQWKLDWAPAPGDHTLVVRATDKTGATQPVERTRPDPDGARGWHIRAVTIV